MARSIHTSGRRTAFVAVRSVASRVSIIILTRIGSVRRRQLAAAIFLVLVAVIIAAAIALVIILVVEVEFGLFIILRVAIVFLKGDETSLAVASRPHPTRSSRSR